MALEKGTNPNLIPAVFTILGLSGVLFYWMRRKFRQSNRSANEPRGEDHVAAAQDRLRQEIAKSVAFLKQIGHRPGSEGQ